MARWQDSSCVAALGEWLLLDNVSACIVIGERLRWGIGLSLLRFVL